MAGSGEVTGETLDAGGAAPREQAPGTRLGKYKLERMLGEGGMGVVWAAHDPDLERTVALKVLRYEQASVELRQRLLREARAMAKLKHPNVLTVYEVGSDGDRDFIAMELVDGASLDRWAETHPARHDIWEAILAAGRGLAAAHRAGLVHRDFKPHNVLRSSDGRVLVTDFGLARSHGGDDRAQPALDVTLPVRGAALEATIDVTPAPPTSSTDTTLTRTGAVLGTPAYMAPEQFLGAASDPRTDQFAFCVTAWQLLSGERPFRGSTLDELRRAASSGTIDIKGKLPRAIRAVLVRGLAPEREQRWADVNTLLAALERAHGSTRRRIAIAAAAVALAGIAGVAVISLRGHTRAGDASACDASPEVEMAKAWSPDHRQRLVDTFGDVPGTRLVIGEIDAFAARWTSDYRNACAAPRNTHTFAKLGCLLGERDIVGGMTELIPTVPQNVIAQIEMGGVLPRPEACDGNSPVAPPTMPDDLAQRDKISALRPKLIASRWAPPRQMVIAMPALLKDAEALDWEPIVAEAHQAYAITAERVGDWELARDQYKAAFDAARRSHHEQLAADMSIGVLGTETQAASDPTNGKALDELVAQARLAVKAGGDDPHFVAQIAQIEAEVASARGQLDVAIAKYEQAHALEVTAVHDIGFATRLMSELAFVKLRRDRAGDVDEVWNEIAQAEHDAKAAHLPDNKLRSLVGIARYTAQLRGDLVAAHAWADRDGAPSPPEGAQAISGRVLGADGKGVAGATVVAWRGRLDGDPERVYLGSGFEGAIATSGPDGAFTIQATRDGAIIAELGDQRSAPRPIGDGSPTLALAATRTVTGTVASGDQLLTGIVAIAHYDLGRGVAWECIVPVGRARDYKLARLPAGPATLRLTHWLDPNNSERKLDFGPVDTAKPAWPTGPALDVIVRGLHDATIWVVHGSHAAKTHADLDHLVEASNEVAIHPALVIGIADDTPAGLKEYARGDQHGIVIANRPGPTTVCAAEREPTAPAVCVQLDVPNLPSGAPAIAVVLKR